ncbi:MAG: TrmH family tRNA/rRNA methyltransferase [Bacteroidetes bacterium]|nr:TrmH family tRNA/rRNA methyltransferase [Bacteroidota bacterium]
MRKLQNEELKRKSVDEFKQSSKTPIVIVLDNVRSLNNVGSVFRTADAFLIEAVYLCGITGQPPHKEIQKTALGATESVSWKYLDNTLEAVNELKDDGYLVYAIEQAESAIMLNNFMPARKQKIAIIFGNEVKGVQQEVIDASTDVIEIPQVGTKHSLNIAVSVGIVMWDLYLKIK